MQKHPINAYHEKLTYSPEMLYSEWNKIAERFADLIKGGWANETVLDLIDHIKNSKYSSEFYPGSSLGRLLISKPENGKLNYQRTLSVETKMNEKEIVLEYSDWDTINDKSENPVLWRTECQPENLIEKFDEFIKWNKNWC
ncbi:MAG: hypothetical protein CMC14_00740 [Flavobacteriaceae bacterium]|nr:hypothetical protein [Flavobacteriaceae bacterium]|tara:strand:+ start:245 stop:667 length:423 start_codon:yes stop_codon:yes gene_type:complete